MHGEMDGGPDISIVVPTYNRCDQLRRVLESLGRQVIDRSYEVVVVSDGSTDGTDAFLARHRPGAVVAISQSNAGPAAARNAGVSAARGRLIVFVDDDVIAEPDLVARHHEAHARLGDGHVVIGPMATPTDVRLNPWVLWEQRQLERQYADMRVGRWDITARQFYTGNASVSRQLFLDVGGFDPSYRRAEDVEFGMRLARHGAVFVFEPDAVGYHYADRSYGSWQGNAYAYGRNDVRMARAYPDLYPLESIVRKYRTDHVLLQWSSGLALPRPRARSAIQGTLRALAQGADRVRCSTVASIALSGIYANEYYRGVADELGGVQPFQQLLRAA